jgi:RimJ/RimL family protein N-acetyltransferase
MGKSAEGNGIEMDLFLETERLILRTPTPDDAESLQKAINHPEIAATTTNIPHPYSLDDARLWIEESKPKDDSSFVNCIILLKETNEVVGGIGFSNISRKHRRAEIGWWCAIDFWRKGISTEAARRLIRYGFEELEFEQIYASCMTHNPASASVMVKAGMSFLGTGREEIYKKGKPIDLDHYSILSGE